jgi:prevent-host-death family protein
MARLRNCACSRDTALSAALFVQIPQFRRLAMNISLPVTQTMQISEVRARLNNLVNRVYGRESRILVEKSGIPVAAIVSPKDLARLERLDEERERGFEALAAISEKFLDVPIEELEEKVAEVLAEVRAENRSIRDKRMPRSA